MSEAELSMAATALLKKQLGWLELETEKTQKDRDYTSSPADAETYLDKSSH